MTVKKKYNIDDTVWIYGITNGKSTEGKIVQCFNVNYKDWDQDIVHYVVAIPTEIEYLLEVRTWETISQSKDGRVGSLREAFENPDAAHKMLSRTGMIIISTEESKDNNHISIDNLSDEDDISSDAIHAALEKSQKDASHGPLNFKDTKPKRRYFKKKPKV